MLYAKGPVKSGAIVALVEDEQTSRSLQCYQRENGPSGVGTAAAVEEATARAVLGPEKRGA